MFWGIRWGQCPGKGNSLGSPSGDIDLNQMLPLQHGGSLDLYHFQQLWGHLLEWQVRWGTGQGTSSWRARNLY